MQALAQFKGEMVPLLLATDVASRGLDIPTVRAACGSPVNYTSPTPPSPPPHDLKIMTHQSVPYCPSKHPPSQSTPPANSSTTPPPGVDLVVNCALPLLARDYSGPSPSTSFRVYLFVFATA